MQNELKYCELHVHLEGCIWPLHIQRWWDKSKFLFPPPSYSDEISFDKFLEYIRFGYNFLTTPQAYANVVCDYVRRAKQQNICYAELQVNLALLQTWHLDAAEVLATINDAVNEIKDAAILRFIIDMPWQFHANSFNIIVDEASTFRDLGVVGISMGGDENFARIDEVATIFQKAKKEGFKTLCHAGEITDGGFARELVTELKPDRIAHAISIADWIAELGEDAPPIDICLTSNVLLGVVRSFNDHPLKKWYESGVKFSLSTDDPAIFNTDLSKEYAIAKDIITDFTVNPDHLMQNWLSAAFDSKTVQNLLC